MKNKNMRGSMTLEAAMVVPIFILLMLAVNGFFLMFMGQQVLSHTVIQSAKSMAYDPYASQRVTADEGDQLADMFVDLFSYANGDFTSPEEWYEDGAFFSVSQVAEEVGIESEAYFCNSFKKLTGITPKEYRRRAKNQ